ncbi:uncharacterized protein [Ptychodera flava]|uniref:uncharacterized protein n=1 Tax=Ptychodera flava TaxID=63121 RepID=UPI00396A69B2
MKFSPRKDTGNQNNEAYSSACAFADVTSILSSPTTATQDWYDATTLDHYAGWDVCSSAIGESPETGPYQQGSMIPSPSPELLYDTTPTPNTAPFVECSENQVVDFSSLLFPYPTTVLDSLPPIQLPVEHATLQRQCTKSQPKPKRKRIINSAQRKAANIRERRRMFNINEAFDELRKKVPTFAYEKGLSRIETLKLAIVYISFLKEVLEGKDVDEVKLRNLQNFSQQLTNFSLNSKSNSGADFGGHSEDSSPEPGH